MKAVRLIAKSSARCAAITAMLLLAPQFLQAQQDFTPAHSLVDSTGRRPSLFKPADILAVFAVSAGILVVMANHHSIAERSQRPGIQSNGTLKGAANLFDAVAHAPSPRAAPHRLWL